MDKQILKETRSVCPVCLRQLTAVRVKIGENIYLEKTCADHGTFSAVVWRGEPELDDWCFGLSFPKGEGNPRCPHDCGLCGYHGQSTCCMLLEVTGRCNMNCPVCFAEAEQGTLLKGRRQEKGQGEDPSLDTLKRWLSHIGELGGGLVQLSGGEPTVRDDLPMIIKEAKAAGIEYVQLNTNGLRLAEDPSYVKELKEAGLSFVFLQFDGMDDRVYKKLRGRKLLDVKKKAVENCGRESLGVTLVPTLVPGVNTESIGEILRYAIAMSPSVRGVHFQPISYFGRFDKGMAQRDDMRITLPEVIREIERQTGGMIKMDNLAPGNCDHGMCGFHGSFVVWPDEFMALTHRETRNQKIQTAETVDIGGINTGCCCGKDDPAVKNREYIARRWERKGSCCGKDAPQAVEKDLDGFLARAKTHSFTVTAMAFQDCFNLDLERLRKCSLHVYKEGKVVPFCANYLTAAQESF